MSTTEVGRPQRDTPWRDRFLGLLTVIGEVFALMLDSLRELFLSIRTRSFPLGEALGQGWFLFSVCALPTVLTAVPFGVIVALQVGTLASQIGAEAYSGAINVLTVTREAGPLITALIIAGVGGSAICADLGA